MKSGTLAIVTVGPFPAAVCSIAPSGVLTVIVNSPVVVVVLGFCITFPPKSMEYWVPPGCELLHAEVIVTFVVPPTVAAVHVASRKF